MNGGRRLFSLRRILTASLVLLAIVPAVLVLWLMSRASTQAVEDLAGKILTQVAGVIQTATESHIQQVHDVLDGLVSERPGEAELKQARAGLRQLSQYEPMAFALTRQSADVPVVHIANLNGEYFGVERRDADVVVAIRRPGGTGRAFFQAAAPGDRSHPLDAEPANFEPRTTPWYSGALSAKGRVFTPVQVSPVRKQLVVSLSQPVFDADGGAAGVFGADLYLKQLADMLRTQRISSHGGAFIVDEKGRLVASSAGDALYAGSGAFERTTPESSVNPIIRASFANLKAMWSARSEDTVATNTSLQRLPMEGDTLLMVQRPFGEALGLHWTLVVAAPESDFTSEIGKAFRVSFASMAALIALGTLIAFFIARSIGRRLGRLGEAAEQLGRGEVPQIEQGTRIREVNRLSQVLHDSAEQLLAYRGQVEAQNRALHEANETLEQRVERRTAELAASREEALAAARAKAAFLATMSHEIRTPLNGVVGMSTLLAETRLDAEQRDYLQTIRLSSDQLLSVINDVLDFSKIESGKLDLETEPVSVRGAVEEACDIAAPRAREKGLELIIDVADQGPGAVPDAIKGDVTRLRQVLINLINNAVKFTPKGEVAVHVKLLQADDGQGRCVLEFRVADTGIGIPPERVGALFEAFTQVDASTTRKYGGTGLGLAICKRLVEMMGGTMGVESEQGRGSTFWFTLAAPATQLTQAAALADAGLLGGKLALVVDDHATNVRVLTRQLQLWGLQTLSAESAPAALRLLEQQEGVPDVVITDMHMPDMDGVAFARALRANARWSHVPIVLLSSGFMPSGEESASLFQARLLKPARQTQMFETMVRCIVPEAAQATRAGEAAPDARKHATVLVADDNAVNLKVACAMLLKLGYDIVTATDGREAVEAVARAAATGTRIAAVLMDVNMPEVDGLEATRQIQAAYGKAAPPIIALTAAASAEDRQRCQDAGMDDYLTKPLHVSALAQALERWIAPSGEARADATPAAPAAAPKSAPEAPVMDFSRLEEFREFDDAELTMTREVIGLFLSDTPPRLDAIEAAIGSQDADALCKAAHALKGGASNIGAKAIQQHADAMEAASREGSMPLDADVRSAKLRELWEQTRAVLEAWR